MDHAEQVHHEVHQGVQGHASAHAVVVGDPVKFGQSDVAACRKLLPMSRPARSILSLIALACSAFAVAEFVRNQPAPAGVMAMVHGQAVAVGANAVRYRFVAAGEEHPGVRFGTDGLTQGVIVYRAGYRQFGALWGGFGTSSTHSRHYKCPHCICPCSTPARFGGLAFRTADGSRGLPRRSRTGIDGAAPRVRAAAMIRRQR